MVRLAIYPGSFDPPTYGHLDVLERASKLFERIIVAIGVNREKEGFLNTEERMEALRATTAQYANVEVDSFDGLLVHYAQSKGAKAVVRGLRATSDFEYEFQIAMANRRLNPDIETIFLMTKWEHSYLSSSIVREVATLGGDYTAFVPPEVAGIIERKLKAGS